MSLLEREVDLNFCRFSADWTSQIESNWLALGQQKVFSESYRRISAINALKATLVVPNYSAESSAFFLEAHNDLLVSHVTASCGSWRAALQSLRSSLENTVCAIYYNDHPVEFTLWSEGKFRIGFSDLYGYLTKHPTIARSRLEVSGLDIIQAEYATLSKAVHASATNFRMTENSSVLLWNTDPIRANMWASREKKVVEGISLLLVALFRDELTGAKHSSLRDVLYFAISPAKRSLLKSELRITVSKPQ